tara:strand:- start:24 stop:482 length:459 start_codon:yes stop_codon:yes gene_type:complete
MTYTEIKEIHGRKYYYRVRSVREGLKFRKERIYLGKGLTKRELVLKEAFADKKLNLAKKSKALEKIIPKIRKILKKNKVKKAGVFGSYASGEQKRKSDIDILVEPPKSIGFGFVGIQFELEDALKKKVDLVSYNGLSPYLKSKILEQEVRIL